MNIFQNSNKEKRILPITKDDQQRLTRRRASQLDGYRGKAATSPI